MGYSKLSPALLKQFNIEQKSNQNKSIVVLARKASSIFWNNIILGISEEINKYQSMLQVNFISDDDEKKLVLPVNFQDKIDGIIFLRSFRIST
ncbi:MAG: hypothetical protein C0P72_006420 [Clostridia bacterium]